MICEANQLEELGVELKNITNHVYMGERVFFFLFMGRSPLLRRSDRRERIRSRARLKWKYMRRDLTKTVESFRYINLSYEECYHDEVMDKKLMRK